MNCPKCSEKMPFISKATSVHQALLGGWTCRNCGCEMDRKGRERTGDLATQNMIAILVLVILGGVVLWLGLK